MTNSDNAVRVDEDELLLITLMRHNPSAEVQILECGELLSATRAGQILSYIREMQAAAWDEGYRAHADDTFRDQELRKYDGLFGDAQTTPNHYGTTK